MGSTQGVRAGSGYDVQNDIKSHAVWRSRLVRSSMRTNSVPATERVEQGFSLADERAEDTDLHSPHPASPPDGPTSGVDTDDFESMPRPGTGLFPTSVGLPE